MNNALAVIVILALMGSALFMQERLESRIQMEDRV